MCKGESSRELIGLERSNQLCVGLFTHVQNGGSDGVRVNRDTTDINRLAPSMSQ